MDHLETVSNKVNATTSPSVQEATITLLENATTRNTEENVTVFSTDDTPTALADESTGLNPENQNRDEEEALAELGHDLPPRESVPPRFREIH
ncbi:hypothetical protein Dimus_036474 [Dionaea muscipula]